jgi:diguanylate cyclase (GGDEF)-like protein
MATRTTVPLFCQMKSCLNDLTLQFQRDGIQVDLSGQIRNYRSSLLISAAGALVLVFVVTLALDALINWQVRIALQNNAEIRAQHWADNFFRTTPSARRMVERGITTPSERSRIESSFPLVDVIRFEMFNKEGMQTLFSDTGVLGPTELFSANARKVFETGEPIVGIHEHKNDDDHAAHVETYVEVYLPAVLPTGERIGALEAYVDVSDFEKALGKVFQRISGYLILGTFVMLLFPALAYVYRTRQVMRKDKRLLELTRYDLVTGALNRNSISEFLKGHFESVSTLPSLGILFIDVDHFKQVNDKYGHACGDALLRHFADLLKSSTRNQDDIVGRYGGDEFVLFSRGVTLEDFRKLYGRVMEATKKACEYQGTSHQPSLSVGAYLATSEDTENMALRRADLALFTAKRRGRNQVVEYSEDLEGLFEQNDTKATA